MLKNIKDIERYINKKMSPEEMKRFTRRLESDEGLKKDFLLFQELDDYMEGKLMIEELENDPLLSEIEKNTEKDVDDFLAGGKKDEKILDILAEVFSDKLNTEEDILYEGKERGKRNEKKPKKRTLYYLMGLAAAVLILLFIVVHTEKHKPLNERIYCEFHKTPYELTGIRVRGDSDELNITFEKASALYEQKKYIEASVEFNKLVKRDTAFTQVLFYLGLAQLEAGKTDEAVETFKKVIKYFDDYNLESKWYISLAYIKNKEYQKAVPFLRTLTTQKCMYQKDAEKILEMIKK
jgi:tetratricopeptide (TPR) repeat protein